MISCSSRLWLFVIAALSLDLWQLDRPEENYKSRRHLRQEWRGVGRLGEQHYGFKDYTWAGKYRPDKAVNWVANTDAEMPVSGDIDLCGHSCSEGVSIFGHAVCEVDWQTGCPETDPPEGVTPESSLYDLCPKECDSVDPAKQAQSGGNVLDHIKVWTVSDGKHWEKSKVRIELMPQPNPNIQEKKPKRDHTCVCTGCPKPKKKEIKIDPKKLARAKGEEPPDDKKDVTTKGDKPKKPDVAQDEPETAIAGDDYEWVLSGSEEDSVNPAEGTNAGKEVEESTTDACPQCCMDSFKSDWNHVIFHELHEGKQDEPEVEVAFFEDSEEH